MKAEKFLESNGFFCCDCLHFFNENELNFDIKAVFNTKYGTLHPSKIQVKKCCACCGGTPEIENFSPFAWYHIIAKIEYYIKNGKNKELPEIIFIFKVYKNNNGNYEFCDSIVTKNYNDVQQYADSENFLINIECITQQNNSIIFGIDFE